MIVISSNSSISVYTTNGRFPRFEELVEIDLLIVIEIRFVEILIDTVGQHAVRPSFVREEGIEKAVEIVARPRALSRREDGRKAHWLCANTYF